MKLRSSSYKTYQKYWNIDQKNKRACIPRLIWNDGHAEWSRWPEFRIFIYEHVGKGRYSMN